VEICYNRGDWIMICEIYGYEMSISEISRRFHIDRKTARKYTKSKEIPRYHSKKLER
jgi:transposase